MKSISWKNFKAIVTTIVLVLTSCALYSQTFASRDPVLAKFGVTHDVQKLRDVILDLTAHYGVNILFEEKLLEGIEVVEPKLDYTSHIEQNLRNILQPHGLNFLKVKKRSYLILASKVSKTPDVVNDLEFHSRKGVMTANRSARVKGTFNRAHFPIKGELLLQGAISGKVVDESGAPLPGVNVLIKGTTVGTTTDANGNYSLSYSQSNVVLVFSFIGYITMEIPVEGRTTINVSLAVDTKMLEEVIVVSYGTQKQREVTGSIEHLNAEELKDMPVGEFAQKLQGKIAGVQINQTTGRPGQGMDFRIRGAASINAGNTPLFVVDGQPITGNINNINPDEIESFSILKDASATALYGSRAANGVILITTRQAASGKTTVEFNASYGVASLPQRGRPDMMNAREFATYMKEFYEDKITYEGYALGIPAEYADPSQYGEGTDWLEVLLRDAPIQNYSLSIGNASEKASVNVIAGYFNQQGILINTGYQRYTLRANSEFRPNNKVRIGLNLAPSLQLDHNTRANSNTDGQRTVIEGAMLSSPLRSHINPDGTLPVSITGFNQFPMPNWYRYIQERENDNKTNRLLANAYVEYNVLNDLKFKARADMDMGSDIAKSFYPSTSVGGFNSAPPRPATGQYGSSNYYSWLNENTFNYKKTFSNDHSVDALAGYTIQKFQSESGTINGTDFPDDMVTWLSAAATVTKGGGFAPSEWALLSMIGRVNYNYKGKYLISGAIRRDGSSRFGEERRWGTFPSISAGWIISDESFMQNTKGISYLKLRASYGVTGNNNIGNYTSYSLMGGTNYVFNNQLAQGRSITQLGNTLLSWEKNKQFDLGADINLISDRITLTYDYYHKITDGLLYQINISQASGFNSVQSNIGTFKFWGHEFSLHYRTASGPVKWNADFNISFNRNLVTKLGTEDLPIFPSNSVNQPWITEVGKPMGQFYGFVYDGVYMTQEEFDSQPKHATSMVGTVRMKDLNGDGVIDLSDRQILGDPNPDFLFGMTHDFKFRNFDFNIVFSGAVGGLIRDGMAESSQNLDGVFNVNKDVSERWRSLENPGKGVVPRTRATTTSLYRNLHSNFIHDGTFVTAKNISLGYSFNMSNTNHINKLRVYASVQQAFILTNYPGMNPEVSSAGLNGTRLGNDNTAYPVPRTIVIGLNLGL